MTLGNNIKTLRKSRGITREELAGLTGLSERSIRDIERDRCAPGLNPLNKIAKGMDISLCGLLETVPEYANQPKPPSFELSQTLQAGVRTLSARCHPEYPALLRQGGIISTQKRTDRDIIRVTPPRLAQGGFRRPRRTLIRFFQERTMKDGTRDVGQLKQDVLNN